MKKVLAVCGSLRVGSRNLALLRRIQEICKERLSVQITHMIRGLPLFSPDLEEYVPDVVETWRKSLAQSDMVLIASPEYGHSIPGGLKNAIDWVIGSGEIYRKPVAITASVGGVQVGLRGLEALRVTLAAVECHIMWNQPIVMGETELEDIYNLIEVLST